MATKQAAQAKKKAAPKAYHHGDLRHALVAAAREELRAVGRQELSLRSVARRAGVTHTSAYHHFKDKQALLSVIAGQGFVALDAAMRDAMDAAGDDAVDRLLASGRGYLQMAKSDPAAYDLMFNGCDFDVDADLMAIGSTPFSRLFQAVVAARQATGTTKNDDLSDAMLMWEVVHGAAMLYQSGTLARMGIDLDAHAATVLPRLAALFGR